MKIRGSHLVRATGWCGEQATVGEYAYHPYRGPNNVRLVRPELRLYSTDYKPAKRPEMEFLEPEDAHLSNCPGCKRAFKRQKPVPTPHVRRMAESKARTCRKAACS
jgi:hypothetical protein